MKIKSIMATLLLSVFLVGSAFALPYSVTFDPDGSGSVVGAEIWGFDTEGIAQYSVGGATAGTTYIRQDLGGDSKLGNGDTFTEIFTTKVNNGVDSSGNQNTVNYFIFPDSNNLKIDISLAGYIFGYNNGFVGVNPALDTTRAQYYNIADDSYYTQINGGAAKMYLDANNDNNYDAGEKVAATFSFSQAAPSFLADNVWPSDGGSSLFSVAFKLDTVNDSDTFWTDGSFPTSLANLMANGFVFTYNDGSAHGVGIEGAPGSPDNTIVLSFSDNGIDVVFSAVPEPATMALFGLGLLSLAGVSRRKIQN